jgi:hypothetical protein
MSVKVLFVTVLVAIFLIACGRPGSPAYDLAPQSALPSELQSQPASVQEAYRFAIANPEILKQVPCYCGCGSIGHEIISKQNVSSQ